jgi:tRNA 2-thiocytidine biosynthesis protein TtcA
MLAATQNVRPSHLLDKGLWRSLGLEAAREVENDGLVGVARLMRDARPAVEG